MEYFLTTYRKDFKWPTTKAPANLRQSEKHDKTIKELALRDTEPCVEEPHGGKVQQPPAEDDMSNAGSTYLKKLFTKYPYLKQVMKFTNPDEMAKKILSEKYKTTYQIEYNKDEFHPANNFAEMMDVLDAVEKGKTETDEEVIGCVAEGGPPVKCKCAQGLSFAPCKCAKDAPVRKIAWKPAPISKLPQAPREKKKKKNKEEEEKAQKAAADKDSRKVKPFCSEYNDTIGKVGGLIIKKKLLSHEEPPIPVK